MLKLNIFKFLKEVREELLKVVWPDKQQTIRYTILVIIVVVGSGALLGGFDYLLTALTAFFLQNVKG